MEHTTPENKNIWHESKPGFAAELAKKHKITVSEEEINGEIEKMRAMVSAKGGTLETMLAEHGLTEEELRDKIAAREELEKLFANEVADAH